VSEHDIWVFGYGSLMWKPGFSFLEARRALLVGRQRALCVYSVNHRGTCENPGLVFGLDRGGSCEGIAFRVAASKADDTLHYLQEREQVTGVYRERILPIRLGAPEIVDGQETPESTLTKTRTVRAVVFVVDETHRQYVTDLSIDVQAEIIRAARGKGGPNADYVLQTAERLKAMNVRDTHLERLVGLLLRSPEGLEYKRTGQGCRSLITARLRHVGNFARRPRFGRAIELKANYRRRIDGL